MGTPDFRDFFRLLAFVLRLPDGSHRNIQFMPYIGRLNLAYLPVMHVSKHAGGPILTSRGLAARFVAYRHVHCATTVDVAGGVVGPRKWGVVTTSRFRPMNKPRPPASFAF